VTFAARNPDGGESIRSRGPLARSHRTLWTDSGLAVLELFDAAGKCIAVYEREPHEEAGRLADDWDDASMGALLAGSKPSHAKRG
jgi:hypothetical protein